jgi:ribosomal protein L37AE/L43A
MSDAFERQFRPRDTTSSSQASSQRHGLPSSTGSFRHRPAGNGLATNGIEPGTSMYRPDWELSQQEALREFQQHKYQREQPHPFQAAIQQSAPTIPTSPAAQLDLVRRGAAETARAVQVGRAHIVQCQNCQARLQAPIQYALVYCPSCGVVSPGRSYVPTTSMSASSNSSGYASSEQGPTSPGGSSLQGGDASSDRKSWN